MVLSCPQCGIVVESHQHFQAQRDPSQAVVPYNQDRQVLDEKALKMLPIQRLFNEKRAAVMAEGGIVQSTILFAASIKKSKTVGKRSPDMEGSRPRCVEGLSRPRCVEGFANSRLGYILASLS